MKKGIVLVLAAAALSSGAFGCAYGGVATAGDKVVVARNDGFLFGILRKAYVCKVSDAGLTACQTNENP